MRKRRHVLQVSTFPFLAVLLCAMGSLILLLLVIDRRAKVVARAKALQAASQVEAQETKMVAAQKAELERRSQLLHARLLQQEQDLVLQVQTTHAKADTTSRTLRDEQTQVEAEEAQVEEGAAALSRRQAEIEARRAELSRTAKLDEASRAELTRLAGELRDLERTLADLKAVRQQSQQTFSLVPYRGRRGDNRRPLYVECTADGVVFHPDRLAVTGIDLAPRTIREEVQRRLINQPAGDSPARKPYLLMLVRPNGITSYYRALAALHGLGVDFGYEFIEADWVLDFPQDDSAMVPQPWMTQVTPGTLPPPPRPRTGPVPSRPLPAGMAPSGASGMVADGTTPSNAGAPPTGARSAGNMIATSLQGGSTGSPGAGSGSGPGPGGPFSPGDGNAPGGAAGRGLTGGSPFKSGGQPVGVRGAGSAARLEFGAIGPSGAAAGSGPGPGGSFAGGPGGPGGAAGSPGVPGGNAIATGGQSVGVGRPGGGTNPYAGSSGQSGFAPGTGPGPGGPFAGGLGGPAGAAGSPGVPGGNAMATGGQSAGVGRPGGGTNPYAGSSGQSGSAPGSGPGPGGPFAGNNGSPSGATARAAGVGRPDSGTTLPSGSSGQAGATPGIGPGPAGQLAGGPGGPAGDGSSRGTTGTSAHANALRDPTALWPGTGGNGTGGAGTFPVVHNELESPGPMARPAGAAGPTQAAAAQAGFSFAPGQAGGTGGVQGDALVKGPDAATTGAGGWRPDVPAPKDRQAAQPGADTGLPNAQQPGSGQATSAPVAAGLAPPLPAPPPSTGQPAQGGVPEIMPGLHSGTGQPGGSGGGSCAQGTGSPGTGASGGGSGSGGEGGGDPAEDHPASRMFASGAPTTARPIRRPGILRGNRDWVISIECRADGVLLYPNRLPFNRAILEQGQADNLLYQMVRQMIDRRQASVYPGEPPYRPLIRFLVRPEGLRSYYTAYPILEQLKIPMSRTDIRPDEEANKAGLAIAACGLATTPPNCDLGFACSVGDP